MKTKRHISRNLDDILSIKLLSFDNKKETRRISFSLDMVTIIKSNKVSQIEFYYLLKYLLPVPATGTLLALASLLLGTTILTGSLKKLP
jgi:hypothetical protein